MRPVFRLAAFALYLIVSGPVLADPANVLARWYDGLAAGDATVLAPLIADEAVFVLEDIGIEQNRDAFLESLPEWREAIAGGSIDWRLDEAGADTATVVEVHAHDRIGALYRVARVFAEFDLDVRTAKIQTLGEVIVDAFYVTHADGSLIDDRDLREELERSLLHAAG